MPQPKAKMWMKFASCRSWLEESRRRVNLLIGGSYAGIEGYRKLSESSNTRTTSAKEGGIRYRIASHCRYTFGKESR
jgi:hypothetical protein